MNVAHPSSRQLLPWQVLTRGLAGLFIAFLFACFGATLAHAAAPAANSVISNQATATYFNSTATGAQQQNVSSNQVSTTVTQVYAVGLASDGTRTATPGSQVYFPHTVTNNGNGTDSFTLSATSAATPYQLTNVLIYADNGAGQPTGSAITVSPTIAAGATFKFVVSAVVPTTATAASVNAMTVKATSVGDTATTKASASNNDQTTVTVYANIDLSKSIVGSSSGAPGAAIQYKIEYRNTGNQDATSVVITDQLPAGVSYVANSVKWNGSSTVITDGAAAAGSPATIKVTTATVGTGNAARTTVTTTISTVALNTSGYITLNATVGATTSPGVLSNVAGVSYNNGNATATNTSNSVDFTVSASFAVTMTTTTVPSANPGATVLFPNVVTNAGTASDTFNITLGATTGFPSGTTFTLLKSDGATTLTDSDNDGTLDTGPLAPGASYTVYVKAVLPNSAGGNNGGNGWTIVKTATSKYDPSKTASVTDKLTTITTNSVDLAHVTTATGLGTGAGPEASAVKNLSTNPGAAVTFTLYVNNTGSSSDGYTLSASTGSLGTTALPAGWTVDFKADATSSGAACTTTGTSITSTPTVNAGASYTVCAVVTVPAGYVAGVQDLNFFAASSTSGKSDGLHDSVTVNAVRSLSLSPNGNGQTYPGGTYLYSHTLKNTGNVDEAVTVNSALVSTLSQALTNSDGTWSATVYVSTNATFGDSDDQLVTAANLNTFLTTGLPRGASVTLFVKVQAPQGAAAGATNTTTLTITTANGSYTTTAPAAVVATDATTVISGNLKLDKTQSLDTSCAGNVATATFATTQLNAKPGECVIYQIKVTNIGAADAFNVVVSDTTPTFTTLNANAPVTASGSTVVMGTGGQFKVNVGTGNSASTGGTLSANQSATITFGVKIDQ